MRIIYEAAKRLLLINWQSTEKNTLGRGHGKQVYRHRMISCDNSRFLRKMRRDDVLQQLMDKVRDRFGESAITRASLIRPDKDPRQRG